MVRSELMNTRWVVPLQPSSSEPQRLLMRRISPRLRYLRETFVESPGRASGMPPMSVRTPAPAAPPAMPPPPVAPATPVVPAAPVVPALPVVPAAPVALPAPPRPAAAVVPAAPVVLPVPVVPAAPVVFPAPVVPALPLPVLPAAAVPPAPASPCAPVPGEPPHWERVNVVMRQHPTKVSLDLSIATPTVWAQLTQERPANTGPCAPPSSQIPTDRAADRPLPG